MHSSDGVISSYDVYGTRAFSPVSGFSVPSKIAFSLLTALLIGATAQVRVHLPGTPVPVTGQVLAVLLSGVFLGAGYGALSQVFYLGMGAAGLPLFTGYAAGSAALLGVTGGYLIGFVPAVLFIGLCTERFPRRRPLTLSLVMLGGIALIYFFGALQFAAFTGAGLYETFSLAVLPFIVWDILKALAAGAVACYMLPDRA